MPKSNPEIAKARGALRVHVAALLIYLGYRALGATKEHAWERARLQTVDAIIDKVVEVAGIRDPREKDPEGIQAFFEGGPLNGTTRFVAACGAVVVPKAGRPDDDEKHVYRRTDRPRHQQLVFAYQGLMVPPDLASNLPRAA